MEMEAEAHHLQRMLSQRNKKRACDIDHEHPLTRHEWLASRVLQAMGDPRAVCKLALINKNFCAASRSDLVWQTLLPSAGHLDALFTDIPQKQRLLYHKLPKRDLFLLLCKPITFDGGLKKFWLDPLTAGDCYIMSTQALSICSADICEYWKWSSCRGSWFSKVACLRQVRLLEVCGTFRQLLRPGSYVLSFRMKLKLLPPKGGGWQNGWQGKPVKLCVQNVTYSSHPPKESHIFFDNPHSLSYSMYQSPARPHFKSKQSNRLPLWVECDLGEFTVDDDNAGHPVEVMFSMRDVNIPHLKIGFVLDGVIVRPRFVLNNLCRKRPTASSFVSQAWLRSFDDKCFDEDDESEDDLGDDFENDQHDFEYDSEDDSLDESKDEYQGEFAGDHEDKPQGVDESEDKYADDLKDQ